MNDNINLVIVGSVGIDTIETPTEKQEDILGGSVSYACAASSFFTSTGMVSVVGTDFPQSYRNIWAKMNINLDGLQTIKGETFRWSGVYEDNMDNRHTLYTELNVFEQFSPSLPETYLDTPYLFLANIHPQLQLQVLELTKSPKFVLIDTMDIWIDTAKSDLEKVIGKCTMLTLNESEAELFTNEKDPIKAAKKLIRLGPKYVLIKKGAQGSFLYSQEDSFFLNAFPVQYCCDPTGAGDSFAGGLMGKLASLGKMDLESIKQAMIYGSVIASFGIEKFSLDRLKALDQNQIEDRVKQFNKIKNI